MLAALFVPRTADELTLEEAIHRAAGFQLIPCVPKNFSPSREFVVTFFPPDRIPSGWRPAIVAVKTPHRASVKASPCVA